MFLQSYSVMAREIMKKDIYFCSRDSSFEPIYNYLLENTRKEVFVVENQEVTGVITINDIYKIARKNIDSITIEDIMVDKVETVSGDETLSNIRLLMLHKKIGRVPIVEDNRIVGVIREENIRDYFYKGIDDGEEAIKHVFDNINEALCVMDNKGRVIVWNKNAENLYDIKEEDIRGKELAKFFPKAIDLKVFESQEKVRNIYHSPKEGYHVIISASPIVIDGVLYGVVSTEKGLSEVNELKEELSKAKEKVRILEREMDRNQKDPFERIIGHSKLIMNKIEVAKQIAPTNASVLLTGESGTGKEEFARAIHKASKVEGDFVPVNCSAIPGELFESEFFGYEKGAFTGASSEGKAGFFEQARAGTLFLDEIGDMHISMQAKLLRVLQDKKVKRVGGEEFLPADVRIVAATNRDLEKMIKDEEFREDLYYRINVVQIELPALRERREDIVLFIDYFIKLVCIENNKEILKISNEAVDSLVDYSWKGNVRELKNVIENMVLMNRDGTISLEAVPNYIRDSRDDNLNLDLSNMDLNQSVERLEITLIAKALEETAGNKREAAEILNIPRTTLHSKIKKYRIEEQ